MVVVAAAAAVAAAGTKVGGRFYTMRLFEIRITGEHSYNLLLSNYKISNTVTT